MILKKLGDEYKLYSHDSCIATTYESPYKKLSLKNCQAVERDCDFDEYQEGVFYAGQFGHPSPEGFSDEQVGRLYGFIDGFQKALEILSDKKYDETDLYRAFLINSAGNDTTLRNFFEQTVLPMFQNNEWEVEIEMECPECKDYGYISECRDVCNKKFLQPKLDANSCLILKRK